MKRNRLLFTLALAIFSSTVFSQVQSNLQNHILFSSYLEEYRGISVSTPANYGTTDKSYPVLYVLDGEWVFDFSVSCVDFLSNDKMGQIPQMIVVGIPNTNRNKDLGMNRGSDVSSNAFLSFIEGELIPFINKNYRSNDFNLLYGWASGAEICRRMMHERPKLFDAYLESASSMEVNSPVFATTQFLQEHFTNTYHYMSTEASSTYQVQELKSYDQLLDSLNPSGLKWKVDIREDAGRLDLLSQGLSGGLRFVFQEYTIPDSIVQRGAEAITTYFTQINQFYNFEVEIPEGILNGATTLLIQTNKLPEAIQTLLYGIKIHPDSPKLAGRLAQLYRDQKDYEAARKYYRLATEKSRNNRILHLKYKRLYEGIIDE